MLQSCSRRLLVLFADWEKEFIPAWKMTRSLILSCFLSSWQLHMSALSSKPVPAAPKRQLGCLKIPADGGFDDAGFNRIGRCQSYVKRNRDTGRLARVRVHPVIEPAREGNKQPGFGPDSDRFPVRVARRAYGLHTNARIEELQHTAERAIRVELTGVHVIDT